MDAVGIIATTVVVVLMNVALGLWKRARDRARHLEFELGVTNGYVTLAEGRERAAEEREKRSRRDVLALMRALRQTVKERDAARLGRVMATLELWKAKHDLQQARDDARAAVTVALTRLAHVEDERMEALEQLVGYEAAIEEADRIATDLSAAYAQELGRRKTAQRFIEQGLAETTVTIEHAVPATPATLRAIRRIGGVS